MDHQGEPAKKRPRRGHGDQGVALVELSLVVLVLAMLVFGIISFGYLMSFRQDITQAAAEGARAGAVASSGSAASAAATQAVIDSVSAFGKTCNSGGMTCTVTIATCANAAPAQCVTVVVSYDYAGNPLLPNIPVISSAFPDTITQSATAQINP